MKNFVPVIFETKIAFFVNYRNRKVGKTLIYEFKKQVGLFRKRRFFFYFSVSWVDATFFILCRVGLWGWILIFNLTGIGFRLCHTISYFRLALHPTSPKMDYGLKREQNTGLKKPVRPFNNSKFSRHRFALELPLIHKNHNLVKRKIKFIKFLSINFSRLQKFLLTKNTRRIKTFFPTQG